MKNAWNYWRNKALHACCLLPIFSDDIKLLHYYYFYMVKSTTVTWSKTLLNLRFTDHSSNVTASFLYHNTAYQNSNWSKFWKHIMWDNNKQENHLKTLYTFIAVTILKPNAQKRNKDFFFVTVKWCRSLNSWYFNRTSDFFECVFVVHKLYNGWQVTSDKNINNIKMKRIQTGTNNMKKKHVHNFK